MQRLAFVTALVGICISVSAADNDRSIEKIHHVFADADRDGDGRLAMDEFVGKRGAAAALKRDFRLFDFDEDGFLSRDELAAVPGISHPRVRGALPDPMKEPVDKVAAVRPDAVRSIWVYKRSERGR